MICNCNDKTNSGKPKIKHVQGNVLRLAIPLTVRTIEVVDGEIQQTDTDFIPSDEYPVNVVLSKGAVKYTFAATMRDGNVAYVEERGSMAPGVYDIAITCNDEMGNPYRFKQAAAVQVFDATKDAGIEQPVEYDVETWYLDAALYLALKGEDGVGIDRIETQSSGEIGGINTVTFVLTDGRTSSFTILNGSGAVDDELNINSPSPIANKAVATKFSQVDESLDSLFGDVDYDSTSKTIRFWNKDKTRQLIQLDAKPFVKDGMVNSVYISNNTLVITFNTDAGREAIGVPLTSVFNPNNYYNKTQVENRIAQAISNIQVDTSTLVQKSELLTSTTDDGFVKYEKSARVVLENMTGSGQMLSDGDLFFNPINGKIIKNNVKGGMITNTVIGVPDKNLIYANRADGKTYLWNGTEFVATSGSGINAHYDSENERLVFAEGAATVVGERLIINI